MATEFSSSNIEAVEISRELNKLHYDSPKIIDSFATETSKIQDETAEACSKLFTYGQLPKLHRKQHLDFLSYPLTEVLPSNFTGLDASKTWLMYWPLLASYLLDPDTITAELSSRIVDSVFACWDAESGGFGGGNGQKAHLAPTYAALNALAIAGNKVAFAKLNRVEIYKWMLTLKQPDGGFKMTEGGEEDIRAVYCAMASASLLGILTPQLVEGTANWISRCQTYEGGLGGFPNNEAHGGYTFCGLAALSLLGSPIELFPKHLNIDLLLSWLSARQYQPEGGFSGRSNKLVDGCYSWWVGGSWAILEGILPRILSAPIRPLWSKPDLQKYILYCCQASRGGLRDKPGKSPDYYHSVYNLAGLSECQYRYIFSTENYMCPQELGEWGFMWDYEPEMPDVNQIIPENVVEPVNPVYVLPWGKAEEMYKFFLK
ncbi:terpenoid cyclases/protein prenyltransferase alpha-alpha toroid [Dipodascopsis uninucleata]